MSDLKMPIPIRKTATDHKVLLLQSVEAKILVMRGAMLAKASFDERDDQRLERLVSWAGDLRSLIAADRRRQGVRLRVAA